MDDLRLGLLYLSFFGFVPSGFAICCLLYLKKNHPALKPVAIGLLVYQVICAIVVVNDPIPAKNTLKLFSMIIPVTMVAGSSIWLVSKTKNNIERLLGFFISLVGFGLSGFMFAIWVTLIWGTI